jgi:hypothetical protein
MVLQNLQDFGQQLGPGRHPLCDAHADRQEFDRDDASLAISRRIGLHKIAEESCIRAHSDADSVNEQDR